MASVIVAPRTLFEIFRSILALSTIHFTWQTRKTAKARSNSYVVFWPCAAEESEKSISAGILGRASGGFVPPSSTAIETCDADRALFGACDELDINLVEVSFTANILLFALATPRSIVRILLAACFDIESDARDFRANIAKAVCVETSSGWLSKIRCTLRVRCSA